MFKKAYDGGYAIGAFNVNNMEIVQGITEAAAELSESSRREQDCAGRDAGLFHFHDKNPCVLSLICCRDEMSSCKVQRKHVFVNPANVVFTKKHMRFTFYA